MQITKLKATELGETKTVKEIAAYLTAQSGEQITETKVRSAFKQLSIKIKGGRGNTLVIVDDVPADNTPVATTSRVEPTDDQLA